MVTLAFNELIETDLTHSIDSALVSVFGSCQPEWFYTKRVFKNFTKSTGKHIRQSSFNKVPKKHRHRCSGVFQRILQRFSRHHFYITLPWDCFFLLLTFNNYLPCWLYQNNCEIFADLTILKERSNIRATLTILTWKNLIQYKYSLKCKVGCFWRFSYVKNMIHQIGSKNEWLLLSVTFTAKLELDFVLAFENAFS